MSDGVGSRPPRRPCRSELRAGDIPSAICKTGKEPSLGVVFDASFSNKSHVLHKFIS